MGNDTFRTPCIYRLLTGPALCGGLKAMPKPVERDIGPYGEWGLQVRQLICLSDRSLGPSHLNSPGGWRQEKVPMTGRVQEWVVMRIIPSEKKCLTQPNRDTVYTCGPTPIGLNWCQLLPVQLFWVWVSSYEHPPLGVAERMRTANFRRVEIISSIISSPENTQEAWLHMSSLRACFCSFHDILDFTQSWS